MKKLMTKTFARLIVTLESLVVMELPKTKQYPINWII